TTTPVPHTITVMQTWPCMPPLSKSFSVNLPYVSKTTTHPTFGNCRRMIAKYVIRHGNSQYRLDSTPQNLAESWRHTTISISKGQTNSNNRTGRIPVT